MRDNVSIIFAAIFAVLLLIVFPLFSLLTRQDNIAYNEVLTLTTNFVDSVRTKGYFTEKEYTDYLVKLAATQNTYKLDMEYHHKMLIKEVNYTEANPVWVEDTAVYYNSYVENELKDSGIIKFDEGDEFYIKVYNTNITTASLMYNFFLGSSIPRKVINIGYGGKVLNSTGDEFTKTAFNYSYTPYVTFGEVKDKNGKEFKRCYDEEAGTYEMQYCVRNIDIDVEDNNPIQVDFQLHNFAKISEKELSSTTFEENKVYFNTAIKNSISLRGNYISSYEVNVENIDYNADSITGTIKISDIAVGSGAWKTTAYIVIESGLGIGPTGASSSEGTTEQLSLVRKVKYNVNIGGPYLDEATTQKVEATLTKGETAYYKVILTDSDKIEKLELYDTLNSKIIGTKVDVEGKSTFDFDGYHVEVKKNKNKYTEYLVSVTPKFNKLDGVYDYHKYELQLKVTALEYYDFGKTRETTAMSDPVTWKNMIFDVNCSNIEYSSNALTASSYNSIRIYFDIPNFGKVKDIIKNNYNNNSADFFQDLLDNGIIYITRNDNGGKIEIVVDRATSYDNTNDKRWFDIEYHEVLTGGPEKVKGGVNFNFKDVECTAKNYIVNVPKGYNVKQDDDKMIISYNWRSYCWIPVRNFDNENNEYYGDGITKEDIKNSIEKYGGFYVRYGSVISEDSFDGAWKNALNYGSSQLFSSMVYKWQLGTIHSALGNDSPHDKDGTWVADNSKKLIAVLKKDGYECQEYKSSIYNQPQKFQSFEVLYIK